jgi:WD40 repeat protein
VRLWDVENKTEQQILREPGGNLAVSLSFSPDGSLLAVGYSNGMFKVWSVATGETLTTIECDMGWNINVAFSPDGTWLAAYSQNVVLWGVPDEREGYTLQPQIR